MRLKTIVNSIHDSVSIYTQNGDEFDDIFNGEVKNIPDSILELEVKSIGAKQKGIVDIKVLTVREKGEL